MLNLEKIVKKSKIKEYQLKEMNLATGGKITILLTAYFMIPKVMNRVCLNRICWTSFNLLRYWYHHIGEQFRQLSIFWDHILNFNRTVLHLFSSRWQKKSWIMLMIFAYQELNLINSSMNWNNLILKLNLIHLFWMRL